ncbi:MAG: hypothetical protein IKZ08_03840 [Bacteroidales bacterium]|nr:hypothetical protein [Bacteroidales bacterium]MBR5862442.1 hypothetical protein [Bacteroidales bacterium]
MKFLKNLILPFLVVLAGFSVMSRAQGQRNNGGSEEDKDSLVVLLSSKSAKMVDIAGASYRKIIGPARFLHNGTYLLCDTALWSVDSKKIEAWGNVSILQEETVLTSDKLTYFIDMDLAEFRGSVVQLTDKDHNTLRTRHLDYNTKDSVAVFQRGGAMRDKDGQIIESRNGTYDSKTKTFTFTDEVNMFTDSIFVKTRSLIYQSDLDLATFGLATDVWKDENMLSANRGWYDRGREVFFFADKVHVMSEDQEGWSDTLYFYRNTSDVDMLGNAQVTDTTRNVFGLAGRIHYVDSLAKVTMTRRPAVISQTTEEDGSIDTLYLGAERLVYYTVKMCDVDSLVVLDATKRIESMNVDPVGEYRKKAAEAAAKEAEEAARNDPNYRPDAASQGGRKQSGPPQGDRQSGLSQGGKQQAGALGKPTGVSALSRGSSKPSADSLSVSSDSLSMFSDSLSLVSDSLSIAGKVVAEEPEDTTKMGFLEAVKNVRVYKKSMQIVCDSLLYSDLDSLARLYVQPVIWQDITRQYSADSISVMVKDGGMEKASLMANAFIHIQEDSTHYDQIKGTEMLAFFDDQGTLTRFDVLGGASALFYIEENGVFATVNKPESKMLSATFLDGNIQKIYYYDQAKNDAYPIVQLSGDDQKLKGFNWQSEKRPADRNAVTPLSLRPSERRAYQARPHAKFTQTNIYFPGYIGDVYRQMEVRDSLQRVRARERRLAQAREAERERRDSLARLVLVDSLARRDSLAKVDSLARRHVIDSLAVVDSLRHAADSLAAADTSVVLTPEQIKASEKAAKKEAAEKAKAAKKAAKEAKKKAKQEALDAKWAELDRRDADKAAAKEARKLAKERKRKRRALEGQAKQQRRDLEALEKYRLKYEERKSRKSRSK